jgi:hypothetical protein
MTTVIVTAKIWIAAMTLINAPIAIRWLQR